MKCPMCNEHGEYYSEELGRPSTAEVKRCTHCHRGWLPFWTPAERAGIKAMGKTLKDYGWEAVNSPLYVDGWSNMRFAVLDAIRACVKAARKVKEGKQ